MIYSAPSMSAETKNKFVTGNAVFGKNCDHCSTYGVTCRAGGLVAPTPFGQVQIDIDRVGSFNVSGKLDQCAIAKGDVSIETGTEQIKNLAAKARQEYVDDAVSEAKAEAESNLEGEILEIASTNWS